MMVRSSVVLKIHRKKLSAVTRKSHQTLGETVLKIEVVDFFLVAAAERRPIDEPRMNSYRHQCLDCSMVCWKLVSASTTELLENRRLTIYQRRSEIARNDCQLRHVCQSVCRLSAWDHIGRILMKFDIWVFFGTLIRTTVIKIWQE